MSIIITVLILRAMDVTINTMTLGGIAIAMGSLVDDAIVDVENVYKRLKENGRLPDGKRRSVIEVVYDASKEVRTPIFNSSLTNSCQLYSTVFPLWYGGPHAYSRLASRSLWLWLHLP